MGASGSINIAGKVYNTIINITRNELNIDQVKEVITNITNEEYINSITSAKQSITTNISGCVKNVAENIKLSGDTVFSQTATLDISNEIELVGILNSTTESEMNVTNTIVSSIISETINDIASAQEANAVATSSTETASSGLLNLSLSIGIANTTKNYASDTIENIVNASIEDIFKYNSSNVEKVINNLQSTQTYLTNISGCSSNEIKNLEATDAAQFLQTATGKITSIQNGLTQLESAISSIMETVADQQVNNQTTESSTMQTTQVVTLVAETVSTTTADNSSIIKYIIIAACVIGGLGIVSGIIAGIVKGAQNKKKKDEEKKKQEEENKQGEITPEENIENTPEEL